MGGGISQQEVVNEVNTMVANVMVNIALYCNTQNINSQTVTIDCHPVLSDPDSVYEANDACRNCMANIVAAQLAYYNTQREAWNNRPATVDKPIDSDFQNVINAFVTCTTQRCKACDAQNISLSSVISSTLGCNAFNNVKNSLTQKLTASVSQALTNNQDMLSPLAEMLGASSYSDVVYNITNRISAQITDNVISDVQQTLNANQSVTINTDTTANAITQKSALTSVVNYLEKSDIMNNIFSDSEWTTLQDLVNDQNTIGSVGNTVSKAVSYLSRMLTNVVGKVVLFVLILVGVIFMGIVIYVITQAVRKGLKKQHDKNVQEKAQAEALPAFERF